MLGLCCWHIFSKDWGIYDHLVELWLYWYWSGVLVLGYPISSQAALGAV